MSTKYSMIAHVTWSQSELMPEIRFLCKRKNFCFYEDVEGFPEFSLQSFHHFASFSYDQGSDSSYHWINDVQYDIQEFQILNNEKKCKSIRTHFNMTWKIIAKTLMQRYQLQIVSSVKLIMTDTSNWSVVPIWPYSIPSITL